MSEIKDGNYINIQAFMSKDLELKGNELIIYALIFGFCQKDDNCYVGGTEYICEWIHLSDRRTREILIELIKKGLIQKKSIVISSHSCNAYYAFPRDIAISNWNKYKCKTQGQRCQQEKTSSGQNKKCKINNENVKHKVRGANRKKLPVGKNSNQQEKTSMPTGKNFQWPYEKTSSGRMKKLPVAYISNNINNNKINTKREKENTTSKDSHSCNVNSQVTNSTSNETGKNLQWPTLETVISFSLNKIKNLYVSPFDFYDMQVNDDWQEIQNKYGNDWEYAYASKNALTRAKGFPKLNKQEIYNNVQNLSSQ